MSTVRSSVRRLAMAAASLGALALLAAAPGRGAQPEVLVLPTTGVVDDVMASYIANGIQQAQQQGAAAVILRIDTPGGSIESMHKIVQTILESPVPVITWVSPQGARAASAGTFIEIAGNIALMAPGTNIGAASPVTATGGDVGGTEGQKILNDTIASIKALAEARGRNVDWAVSTVQNARSSSAQEAVQLKAVDGIAASLSDVLAFANGKQVTVKGEQVTLALAGAATTEYGMSPVQEFLHLLVDANVAFVLFILGAYGLILELFHPNFATGILGAIALLLSFYGFGNLPLNLVGLGLIVAALALFAIDLTVTSHGAPTVAGLGAFVLGSLILFNGPSVNSPDVGVAWPLIGIMALATAAFMGFVVATAWRIRKMAQTPLGFGGGAALEPGGRHALPLGAVAEVRRPLTPVGSVYAAGEEWSARSADATPLDRGRSVRIVGQDGLTAIVEPTASPDLPGSVLPPASVA